MSESQKNTPFLAPHPEDLNELFLGYEIESFISTDAMGVVYCVIQKSLDRTVALRILPKELSQDFVFCEAFQAETMAVARRYHPNLIGVYDFGKVDEMLFICMEFLPGRSIDNWSNGQAIDPVDLVHLVSLLCNAIADAHEDGIIHRDIKPSDILLELNAQPKIGDFGLARAPELKISEGENIFGIVHCAASEVVSAPHTVDYRADIFSVGVLPHELLTGKLPADDLRPPSLTCRCDLRLDSIVKKATNPLPASRYTSAGEMAKDILATHVLLPRHAPPSPPSIPSQSILRVALLPINPKRLVHARGFTRPFFMFLLILGTIAGGLFYYHKNYGFSFLASTKQEAPIVVKPTPLPEAKPDLAPPEPSPEDSVVGPVSEPVETISPSPVDDTLPPPKLNINAFYQRARKIMQERSKSQINQYQSLLKSNLGGFEADLRSSVRKQGVGAAKQKKAIEESFVTLREGGNHLPPDLAATFSEFPDSEKIASTYLSKQAALDAAFRKAMTSHAATYVVGMEKQIERSRAENDAAAIKFIESEIKLTREDTEYFTNLMLGIVPRSVPSTSGNDDGGFVLSPDTSYDGFVLPVEE